MLSVITSFPELEALSPEWSRLWHDDPRATPFQSPEWLLPWTRHLFGGGQLWTVAQRDNDRLTSLLPLFRWGDKLQNLSFLGAGVTDYLDLLGAPLTEIPGDWTLADLDGIRSDSPLLQLSAPEACGICPTIQLPQSMAELLEQIDPKLALDIRRSTNRLHRAGRVSIARTSDPSDLFSLHQSRWLDRNDTGMLAGEALQRFHREVAVGFHNLGILRLHQLSLNDEPAAAIYAFTHRQRTYAYLSGFAPRYSRLSPGTVLLAHVVEQSIGERVRWFDFLRDGESYKYRWAAKDQPIWRVTLRRG